MSNIIARIRQVIDYKQLSERAFCKEIGVANGFLSKVSDVGSSKLNKILYAYPEISPDWLLTGSGDMLRGEFSNDAMQISRYSATGFDRSLETQNIPLYDFDAVAGLSPVFTGQSSPIDYIRIPNLSRVDGAVPICGDSMYPLLKSGDIVLFRVLSDLSDIMWGEMYLISFVYNDDEYVAVKYINKIEDDPSNILLMSHNRYHASKEIRISSIRALALVKASIRFNTMR